MKNKIINEGNSLDEIVKHFEFFIKFLVQETVQLQCLVANSQINPVPKKIEHKNTLRPKAETYLNKCNFNKGPNSQAFSVSQVSKQSPANNTQFKNTMNKSNVSKIVTFTGNASSAKAPITVKSCPMLHQNCGANSLRLCPLFRKKSVIDRRAIVEKLRLFFCCLFKGHSATTCKFKTKCKFCGSMHNKLLCSSVRNQVAFIIGDETDMTDYDDMGEESNEFDQVDESEQRD